METTLREIQERMESLNQKVQIFECESRPLTDIGLVVVRIKDSIERCRLMVGETDQDNDNIMKAQISLEQALCALSGTVTI